ncbi:MAG TPA: hypothetical protein VEK08_18200 [Planctomycetota bacterium]|nr:hypothetical protein [Planctomycetota bacterium]
MVLKSQLEYACPKCQCSWLPFAPGLSCPQCGRAVPDAEVTAILTEALEAARFNKRLYGKFELEFWITRFLGDRYLEWGFKALQRAEAQAQTPARVVALAALMDTNLEEFAPYREHVLHFLEALIERYREAVSRAPADWEKMPEPEKPFFGRKIIEDPE